MGKDDVWVHINVFLALLCQAEHGAGPLSLYFLSGRVVQINTNLYRKPLVHHISEHCFHVSKCFHLTVVIIFEHKRTHVVK